MSARSVVHQTTQSQSPNSNPWEKCNNILCLPGQTCLINSSNEPYCVVASSTGAQSTSGIGSQSTTQTTGSQSCINVHCAVGWECSVVNGRATCAQNHQSTGSQTSTTGGHQGSGLGACYNYPCGNDSHCVLINNSPHCVQSSGSVSTTGQQSTTSSQSSGLGACSNYPCGKGFHCALINSIPTCIQSSGSCPKGSECMIAKGKEVCITTTIVTSGSPYPPGSGICNDTKVAPKCPDGFICQQISINNAICVPTTLVTPPSILCPSHYPCPLGSSCLVIKGKEGCFPTALMSGGSPIPPGTGLCRDPPTRLRCPKGFTCQQIGYTV
eukprot:gene17403-20762_t